MEIFIILFSLILYCKQSKASLYISKTNSNLTSDIHIRKLSQLSGRTNCHCGWTNKARIVGGTETKINEFPFAAALVNERSNKVFCGATIITPHHALTAAHCTSKKVPLKLLIGDHDYANRHETHAAKLVKIKKVIEHENFREHHYQNDIALLLLKEKITFTQLVGPACIPHKSLKLTYENVKVLGWGRTSTNGPSSRVLRKVNLKVIPLFSCLLRYGNVSYRIPKQLCTYARRKDSCQGDSGGPIIWLDPATSHYILVGIVSYGRACASSDPGVNTDVSFYRNWIDQKIKETDNKDHVCKQI